MKRLILAAMVLLAPASVSTQEPAPPAPDLKLEAEYKVEPGEFATIVPHTSGKRVVWRPLDDVRGHLSILPSAQAADKNALTVFARDRARGKFRFLAITAVGDNPVIAETTIIVWSPEPPPPPPPVDTLKENLQKAYDNDPLAPATRRALVVALAGFYDAAAEFSAEAPLQTTTALFERMKREREKFCHNSQLIELRKVIAAEQRSVFGSEDAPLDDDMRAKAKLLFGRIGKALMEVK